jgi:hypothetical protein
VQKRTLITAKALIFKHSLTVMHFYDQDGRTLGDAWLEAPCKPIHGGLQATVGPVISSTQGQPDPAPTGKNGMRNVSVLVQDKSLTVKADDVVSRQRALISSAYN